MEKALTIGMGPAGYKATQVVGRKDHIRTEFVIFFVWQEPSPSDKLLSPAGEADASAPATGGGFLGMGAGR
jgi:hypothetical protein